MMILLADTEHLPNLILIELILFQHLEYLKLFLFQLQPLFVTPSTAITFDSTDSSKEPILDLVLSIFFPRGLESEKLNLVF